MANLVWSYAKLRTMPDAATLGAIRDAAARLALEKPTEMTPQDASMLLWGHVTLGTLVAPQRVRARRASRTPTRATPPIGIGTDWIPIPIPPCHTRVGGTPRFAGRADQRFGVWPRAAPAT